MNPFLKSVNETRHVSGAILVRCGGFAAAACRRLAGWSRAAVKAPRAPLRGAAATLVKKAQWAPPEPLRRDGRASRCRQRCYGFSTLFVASLGVRKCTRRRDIARALGQTGMASVSKHTSTMIRAKARRRRAPAFNRLPMLQQNRPRTMRPPEPPSTLHERRRPHFIMFHFVPLDVAVGLE